MSDYSRSTMNRRSVLKSSLAVLAGGALSKAAVADASESSIKNVNLNSSPSTLKITDMRYAVVVKPAAGKLPEEQAMVSFKELMEKRALGGNRS